MSAISKFQRIRQDAILMAILLLHPHERGHRISTTIFELACRNCTKNFSEASETIAKRLETTNILEGEGQKRGGEFKKDFQKKDATGDYKAEFRGGIGRGQTQ